MDTRIGPVDRAVAALAERQEGVVEHGQLRALGLSDTAIRGHGGEHWGMRPNASARIHVALPTRSGRSRPGIVIHRPRTLRPEDVVVHAGIPVTTVARTLRDLARKLDEPTLRRALERAERRSSATADAIWTSRWRGSPSSGSRTTRSAATLPRPRRRSGGCSRGPRGSRACGTSRPSR